MADLPVNTDEIRVRIQKQYKSLGNAKPHVKQIWLSARKNEAAAKVANKQTEIDSIKLIRLKDLEVELEMLKTDLEVFTELEKQISVKGIEYLEMKTIK
jgi:hypothetical protein